MNIQEGKPGVMEVYQKRRSLFGASMEWNQYVFIIKDQHLKYYRSSKVSNMFSNNMRDLIIMFDYIVNAPFNQVS